MDKIRMSLSATTPETLDKMILSPSVLSRQTPWKATWGVARMTTEPNPVFLTDSRSLSSSLFVGRAWDIQKFY